LIETGTRTSGNVMPSRKQPPLGGAFFWLCAFYLVYCARPEDWIPGLSHVPLAKISGIAAFLGLLNSLGKTKRKFGNLPRESQYLLAMIGILFISGVLSPVWPGGAISHLLDFCKVYAAWVLTFMLLTSFDRFRRIIFIQSASVAIICAVSIIKGHAYARLEGVIGGIYSNPNDLAFAIVLSLPFCLAFLIATKSILRKMAWLASILIMLMALFMTASRGGFVTLVIAGTLCLWHFGVRGRRFFLIVGAGLVTVTMLLTAGHTLIDRFEAVSSDAELQAGPGQEAALESYEQRKFLMQKAIEGIAHYPILGVGVRNFQIYSGVWRDVHMTYLQIAVEGGIPAAILFLMFFQRAFSNLKVLRKRRDLDMHTVLFVGALHSSMVGFVVGALFAPEAYQFFPYFAVGYTSALIAILKEQDTAESPTVEPITRERRRYACDIRQHASPLGASR
jgi:O-antigen ligase